MHLRHLKRAGKVVTPLRAKTDSALTRQILTHDSVGDSPFILPIIITAMVREADHLTSPVWLRADAI